MNAFILESKMCRLVRLEFRGGLAWLSTQFQEVLKLEGRRKTQGRLESGRAPEKLEQRPGTDRSLW